MSKRPTPTTTTRLRTLLAGLVQMPTFTAETATCQAALDWVEYMVRDLPLRVHNFAHNGHHALVLTTRDTKRPKVMLHCHLDVSPAPPAQMRLTERDGRYYGRGVFDMKYAAAAYLDVLLDLGPDLAHYDLGVIFTTDEETTGGINGAGQLAARGWGGGVVINADAIAGWNIERGAKGIMRYRAHSAGLPGHASRPWQYRNAITQLTRYLDDVASHFPAEPCNDPEHAHNTFNVGALHGGHIANQVAAEATAELDLRVMPGRTTTEMVQLLEDTATRHPHITLTPLILEPPITLDPAHPEAQRLARIITAVTGTAPGFVLSHGASENPHYARQGHTVLMFGPPGGGHHADDEWVSAAGVAQFARIIRAYLDETAQDQPKTARDT
jgi:succinyl-diaminopimelate desuccinylase